MNDIQIQRLMNYYKPKRFNKMFAYTYKKMLEKYPRGDNKERTLNLLACKTKNLGPFTEDINDN